MSRDRGKLRMAEDYPTELRVPVVGDCVIRDGGGLDITRGDSVTHVVSVTPPRAMLGGDPTVRDLIFISAGVWCYRAEYTRAL